MRSSAAAAPRSAWSRASAALFAALLAACNGGSSLNGDDDTFHICTLNLIEDAPSVVFDLDDTAIGTTGYGSATAYQAGHPGQHSVSFEALLPADLDDDDDDDDGTAGFGQPVPYTFLASTDYTLIAYGRMNDVRTFLVEGLEQRESVDDDKIALHFTHASPAAGEVEVYVTATQAGVVARQYVDTLNVTESTPPLELTITRDDDDLDDDSALVVDVTVELVSTASGQTLYRSDTLQFAERKRIHFTIADSIAPGPAPVKLVLMGDASGEHLDRNDRAALRFVHAAVEAPPLDVTVGSSFADGLASNVSFRQRSVYTTVSDGEVGMIAVPSGSPGVFVFFEEFPATAGQYYAAYAIGPLAEVDAVVIAADARGIPTQARFRFLHAAASLRDEDALDIYLRLPGATVDFDDDDTRPDFSSVAYQGVTSYMTLEEGSYDVYFAYAGTSSVVLGPTSFQVGNGQIQTIALIDTQGAARELLLVPDVPD